MTGAAALKRVALGLMMAGLLGGLPLTAIASDQESTASRSSSVDPWESFNRSIYGFNDKVDTVALKPLAEGYRKYIPDLVRTGIDNFLGNIGDVWSMANQLLQGKVEAATTMGFRVASNTLFGLGGLLDPATEMGLERKSEDFGQTLGRWGVPPGPYVMVPFLGPSTARDTVALPLDRSMGPTYLAHSTPEVVGVVLLQAISTRAGLLGASNLLDDIALDKYSFLRDLYLARRRNQVYDGNPPEIPDEEEPPTAELPADKP